jgi:S-layer homology domain
VVLTEGWPIYTPPTPTFRDVPTSDTFYQFIETAYNHNIISGYACGPGCVEFRLGNNATRGQICKIVYLAITQEPTTATAATTTTATATVMLTATQSTTATSKPTTAPTRTETPTNTPSSTATLGP